MEDKGEFAMVQTEDKREEEALSESKSVEKHEKKEDDVKNENELKKRRS